MIETALEYKYSHVCSFTRKIQSSRLYTDQGFYIYYLWLLSQFVQFVFPLLFEIVEKGGEGISSSRLSHQTGRVCA